MTFVFCSLLELAWVGYLSREELDTSKSITATAKVSPTVHQDDDNIKLMHQDRYEANSLHPRLNFYIVLSNIVLY